VAESALSNSNFLRFKIALRDQRELETHRTKTAKYFDCVRNQRRCVCEDGSSGRPNPFGHNFAHWAIEFMAETLVRLNARRRKSIRAETQHRHVLDIDPSFIRVPFRPIQTSAFDL
jgi:hypothetical protein